MVQVTDNDCIVTCVDFKFGNSLHHEVRTKNYFQILWKPHVHPKKRST